MPADNVVELRVPGVSGTPPEELLGCPTEMLQQLSGDKVAGVYRCRPGSDTPGTSATSPQIEGYYWGGLTSGAATLVAYRCGDGDDHRWLPHGVVEVVSCRRCKRVRT
ncbi:MAG TPA: hypothetical protein VEF72_23050 [Mycobacterium sp.]|nr:hypothetical protein [Mycobacterium sp.]